MPTPGEPLDGNDAKRAALIIRLIRLEETRSGHPDEAKAIRRQLRELRNLDHP